MTKENKFIKGYGKAIGKINISTPKYKETKKSGGNFLLQYSKGINTKLQKRVR
ncbi:MAG: hypothetical protein ABSG05_03535 [Candidatus Pacearchaeota archaeon]|jgi:hypothetical protein